ncbi:MAG: hypothetical protein VXW65_13715 [Pseudomonadota bacterium]|nr:hypothetical protein [Pseudomonadota bacterium]
MNEQRTKKRPNLQDDQSGLSYSVLHAAWRSRMRGFGATMVMGMFVVGGLLGAGGMWLTQHLQQADMHTGSNTDQPADRLPTASAQDTIQAQHQSSPLTAASDASPVQAVILSEVSEPNGESSTRQALTQLSQTKDHTQPAVHQNPFGSLKPNVSAPTNTAQPEQKIRSGQSPTPLNATKNSALATPAKSPPVQVNGAQQQPLQSAKKPSSDMGGTSKQSAEATHMTTEKNQAKQKPDLIAALVEEPAQANDMVSVLIKALEE